MFGGLLSAHYLTNATIYLERAIELADRLMPVFDSPSGLPWSMVNLGQRKGVPDRDNNGLSSTAEVGTLQLEFKYLSYLTDDDTYWKAVEKVSLTLLRSLCEGLIVGHDFYAGYERFEKSTDSIWSGSDLYIVSVQNPDMSTARSILHGNSVRNKDNLSHLRSALALAETHTMSIS